MTIALVSRPLRAYFSLGSVNSSYVADGFEFLYLLRMNTIKGMHSRVL